jgi:hypothetical protein
MRKFGLFSATLFCSIILGGLYGIIHDQVTFSISPEYFTKFKYQQFGLKATGNDRINVAIIGFWATWWFGAFIGLVIGGAALFFKDPREMKAAIIKAIKLVFMIAILFGVAGFLYGKFYLVKTGVQWNFPEELQDKDSFIITGTIHNASYLGGLVGLFIATILLLRKRIYQNYPS